MFRVSHQTAITSLYNISGFYCVMKTTLCSLSGRSWIYVCYLDQWFLQDVPRSFVSYSIADKRKFVNTGV